jgi:hypothetical protein
MKGGPLCLGFVNLRDKVVDKLIDLRKKYSDFVINSEKTTISLMKANWGGKDTTPIQCPSWAILSLDHMRRVKQPCCKGSAHNNDLQPICEDYSFGCYSVLMANGISDP